MKTWLNILLLVWVISYSCAKRGGQCKSSNKLLSTICPQQMLCSKSCLVTSFPVNFFLSSSVLLSLYFHAHFLILSLFFAVTHTLFSCSLCLSMLSYLPCVISFQHIILLIPSKAYCIFISATLSLLSACFFPSERLSSMNFLFRSPFPKNCAVMDSHFITHACVPSTPPVGQLRLLSTHQNHCTGLSEYLCMCR